MLATACAGPGDDSGDDGVGAPQLPDEFDERPVVRATPAPPPVSGGTLALTRDGSYAVAADPDRDAIFVADLRSKRLVHTVQLEPGAEPGRIAEDVGAVAHVALRGTGAVVALDVAAGVLLRGAHACPHPRGVALDAQLGVVHVACAGGDLVTLDAGTYIEERRVDLGPDLRDVVLASDGLWVSRFRSASMHRLALDGSVVVDVLGNIEEVHSGLERRLVSNTAWRTVRTPDGGWVMLHQRSSTELVSIAPEEPDPYGGDGGACPGLVNAAVTRRGSDGEMSGIGPMKRAVLAVDIAVAETGAMAFAVAGQLRNEDAPEQTADSIVVLGDEHLSPAGTVLRCVNPTDHPVPGQPTSVRWRDGETVVVLSREPAELMILNVVDETRDTIALSPESRYDTGHDLFHQRAGAAVACASCHPEATDDGLVWNFSELGPRRTQSLAIGLEDTAPYHWDGEMQDLHTIMDEVFTRRMGGLRQPEPRTGALAGWLFAVPPHRSHRPSELAEQGAATFARYGCATCHSGPALTNNRNQDIRGFPGLQVPSLRGVALHAPYMHDGRAPTLRAAVADMLMRTQPEIPTESDVDAMVAYLRTL